MMQARAFADFTSDSVSIYLRDGGAPLKAVFTEEKVTQGTFTDPTFRLMGGEAQALADSLWSAGYRPSQGKQSEGVTAAQGRHLEDMRAIAFDRLKVVAP